MKENRKDIESKLALNKVEAFTTRNTTEKGDDLRVLLLNKRNELYSIPKKDLASDPEVIETTVFEIKSVLIANSLLIPGAVYKVVDADTNLYEGANVIYLIASSNTTFFKDGIGEFYNPRYQDDRDNGIMNPQLNGGIGEVPIGTKKIWGGRVHTNLTGVYGDMASEVQTSSDWEVIIPTIDNYSTDYVFRLDEIRYDTTFNRIYYRKDSLLGVEVDLNFFNFSGFEHPIQLVQWGNNERSVNIVDVDGEFGLPGETVALVFGCQEVRVFNSKFPLVNNRGDVRNVTITNCDVAGVLLDSGCRLKDANFTFCTGSEFLLVEPQALIEQMDCSYSDIYALRFKQNSSSYKVDIKHSYIELFECTYSGLNSVEINQSAIVEVTIGGLANASITENSVLSSLNIGGRLENIRLSEASFLNNINDPSNTNLQQFLYISKGYMLNLSSGVITDELSNRTYPHPAKDYREDEIVIGKWIDDKPIYRKVIPVIGKGAITVTHNLGIKTYLKHDFILDDTLLNRDLPVVSPTVNNVALFFMNPLSDIIEIDTPSPISVVNIFQSLILEYTKIVD